MSVEIRAFSSIPDRKGQIPSGWQVNHLRGRISIVCEVKGLLFGNQLGDTRSEASSIETRDNDGIRQITTSATLNWNARPKSLMEWSR